MRKRVQFSAMALAMAGVAGGVVVATSPGEPPKSTALSSGSSAKAGTTYQRPYMQVQKYWSKPLKRCMIITLWGTVSYKLSTQNARWKTYHDRTIKQPTMRLTVRTKCGSGGKNVKVNKAKIRQRWWDSSCRAEPSIGGGVPWSVAFAVAFDCGDVKTASRSTSYGKHHTYTQYNSSTKVKWGSTSDAWTWNPYEKDGKWWPLCLSASTTATIWRGAKSDTWPTGKFRVCVRHK
ncbi:hypothetical protein SAMN05443665_103725 [Actinomadura meyerae]|jgi:hypothetical protein|uniref:Uncharacterized protein n=1 Tax=Actinomadura meyerae TaxID=240840 RepID=A0A239N9K7_9ACTN|nr:hypothetical protein [Actinomadura meyerae]SNT50869.1 hypothetical protein SAMN05443665_103725 [Actinomadura meyerae]